MKKVNKRMSVSLLAMLLLMETSPILVNAEQVLSDTMDNTAEINESEVIETEVTETEVTETEVTETEEVNQLENVDNKQEVESKTTIQENSEDVSQLDDTTTGEQVIEKTIIAEDKEVLIEESIQDEAVDNESVRAITEEDILTAESLEEAVLEETEEVNDDVVSEENTTETEELVESVDSSVAIELVEAKVSDDNVTVSPRTLKAETVDEEIVDLSVNEDKASTSAGEYELKFDVDNMTLVQSESNVKVRTNNAETVVSDVEGVESEETLVATPTNEAVSTLLNSITGDEFLIDNDGEIIAADETNFMTVGGVDYITYVYPTLEEASNQENLFSINGGAQSGRYYETVYYEGEYFAHVEIGGLEGYMYLDDIQILPSSFEMEEEYYQNVNGNWTKFVPVDAILSNEYTEYTVGSAPSWATEGVKYYSTDDETFYSAPIGKARNTKAVATGSSYFQNLPFRSTSNYTASQLKSYLNYVGKSSSAYYNATEGFTTGQNEYGINSLFYFSFANHESAYGMSTYAKTCNNFFGRAAIDSDPDKACQGAMGWPTARDGILAQGVFVNQNYADVNMWTYFGTHPGNKQSGMNAVYASDPNWGNAIANHMYRADQYLGGNEEGQYRIYAIKNSEPSFTTSSLTTRVKEMGFGTENWQSWNPTNMSAITDYYQHRRVNTNYGQSVYSQPRVVVTADTANAFQYQIDTPLAQKSQYYSFNQGFSGKYPNFEGNTMGGANQLYPNYVAKGYSNSNVPYGSDWSKQRVWYPKKDLSSGATTYSIVNDVTANPPSVGSEVVYKYDGNRVVSATKYENGEITEYYEYYPEATKSNYTNYIKYHFYVGDNGYLSKAIKYKKGTHTATNYYEYYANTAYGSHSKRIKYRFDLESDGKTLKTAYKFQNGTGARQAIYKYYSGTKYGSHGKNILYRFDLNSDGTLNKAVKYRQGTSSISNIYTYYSNATYGNHSDRIRYRFDINKNGYVYRASKYADRTRRRTNIYDYYPNAKYGSHGNRIKYRFDLDTNEDIKWAYRFADITKKTEVKYYYQANTKYGSHGNRITKRYYY